MFVRLLQLHCASAHQATRRREPKVNKWLDRQLLCSRQAAAVGTQVCRASSWSCESQLTPASRAGPDSGQTLARLSPSALHTAQELRTAATRRSGHLQGPQAADSASRMLTAQTQSCVHVESARRVRPVAGCAADQPSMGRRPKSQISIKPIAAQIAAGAEWPPTQMPQRTMRALLARLPVLRRHWVKARAQPAFVWRRDAPASRPKRRSVIFANGV